MNKTFTDAQVEAALDVYNRTWRTMPAYVRVELNMMMRQALTAAAEAAPDRVADAGKVIEPSDQAASALIDFLPIDAARGLLPSQTKKALRAAYAIDFPALAAAPLPERASEWRDIASAPEGWMLVPIKPTNEMLSAALERREWTRPEGHSWQWVYKPPCEAWAAMLAAAPASEQEGGE